MVVVVVVHPAVVVDEGGEGRHGRRRGLFPHAESRGRKEGNGVTTDGLANVTIIFRPLFSLNHKFFAKCPQASVCM